jgi:N-acetylglutamate synthase-like GNAT family acetyltransferase
MIRYATDNDIDAVESLCREFAEQSMYGKVMTYSRENALECIKNWSSILVAEIDGKLVGFGAIVIATEFFNEREADIDKFYVQPKYRGTGIARMLAESLVKLAIANDARVIYALCGSGINEKNDKMFENLWKKFGLKKTGCLMVGI